jgi:predicted RNase H-like HicB family nuclease
MKDRMQIKIEIQGHEDGQYQAYCPEVGISCRGQTFEDVLERIKDLLAFYFSAIDSAEEMAEEETEVTKQLSLYLKGKNLFVPRNPKIH